MSDKLKELTPVNVNFVQGESPTPSKLENSFDQVATAMNVIERAVGDIWNQSSETGGPHDLNPNYIANLSRAVGNMSKLNPKSLGGNTLSVSGETVPTGKRIFALAHAPDDPATPAAIAFTNPTGVFDTLVASLDLVDSAGDYFIDVSGLVYTFTETGASHTVSYDYTTVTDSYSGATYNVIPDPSQGTRCTVITSGSGYQIGLPVVTDSGSPNYLQQLTIPVELDSLADQDEIPAGFMYVWDNTTNTIVEGVTFKKIGGPASPLNIVYAEGATLALSAGDPDRYTLITVGSQITKMIEALRDLILSHDHQDNQTPFIDHSKILGSDSAVAHGTTSDIVGVDDSQTLTNKILVDPWIKDTAGGGYVTDVIIRVVGGVVSFKDETDTSFQPLDLLCLPDKLTGKKAQYVVDANDGDTGIAANSVPTANQLLALDGSAEFPNSVLKTGAGNGLDADLLDGQHAPAGTIVGTSDTQTLTNKRLDSPKLNSATTTDITSEELETLSDGSNADGLHSHTADIAAPASYPYADTTQTWSSPGSFGWSIPAGVTRIWVAMWGAGGGGGDGGLSKGSGGTGGGGAAFSAVDILVTPGHSVTVNVGAGGIGANGTAPGGNGGQTDVVVNGITIATAPGGGGGQTGNSTPGAGASIGSYGANTYATEYSGLTFVGSTFYYDNASPYRVLRSGGNGGTGVTANAGGGGSAGWGGNGGAASGATNGSAGSAGTNPRFITSENPTLSGSTGDSNVRGDGGKGGGRYLVGNDGGDGKVLIMYKA